MNPVQLREAEADLETPLNRPSGTNPYRLREELQATMQTLVGIFRTKADLEEAIGRIADIRERAADLCVSGGRAFNPGWNLVFELRNLIDISDAIARSALAREESRGAHSRLDFTTTDKAWATRNVFVRREAGELRVGTSPTLPIADDLRVLAEAGGGA